ncbi:MAG: hypothetical protein ACREA9_07285 [Pyrinomonadaceae bacterium]
MIDRAKIVWMVGFLLAVPLVAAAVAVAQESTSDCQKVVRNPQAPAYRLGRSGHLTSDRLQFFADVSVEPRYFTREPMAALARQLNADFCNEKRIQVVIMDDYRAATEWDPVHLSTWYAPAERGSYYLDRVTGEEHIEFSTRRGRGMDAFARFVASENKVEEKTYSGKYRNHNYGYSIRIPKALVGKSEVPRTLEHGIQLTLPSGNKSYLWVGGDYDHARFMFLKWAVGARLDWLRNDGIRVLAVSRRPTRLAGLPAQRVSITYNDSESGPMIHDFIIALRSDPEGGKILYQVEMNTTPSAYPKDSKAFNQIVRSWQLGPLPKE